MNQIPNIKRRIPERTCVTCRKVMPKRELTRLVKTASGEIQIDTGGRLPGRGAYICAQCLKEGVRPKNLEYALKTTVTESDIARLAKVFVEKSQ